MAQEQSAPRTVTAVLSAANRAVRGTFGRSTLVIGRIYDISEFRNSSGYAMRLTNPDAEDFDSAPKLKAVVWRSVGDTTRPEAKERGAVVIVEGQMSVNSKFGGGVELQAKSVTPAAPSNAEEELRCTRAVCEEEQLGASAPPLPLLVRNLLVLAPDGPANTNYSDLTPLLKDPCGASFEMVDMPAMSPDNPALIERSVRSARNRPDVIVFACGGTFPPGTVWDSLDMLRVVDRLQQAGFLVMPAVGHEMCRPLVYEVGAWPVSHPAAVAPTIVNHNKSAVMRLEALGEVQAALRGRTVEHSSSLEVLQRDLRSAALRTIDLAQDRHHQADTSVTVAVSQHNEGRGRALELHRVEVSKGLERRVSASQEKLTTRRAELHVAAKKRVTLRADRHAHIADGAARVSAERLSDLQGRLEGVVEQATARLRRQAQTAGVSLARNADGAARVSAERLSDRQRRLEGVAEQVATALRQQLRLAASGLYATEGTLAGFERGLALISAVDGGPAELLPGQRIRIDTATKTAIAEISKVETTSES